jgi:translation initiation factor IF-2
MEHTLVTEGGVDLIHSPAFLQAETEQTAKTSCAEFSLVAHTRASVHSNHTPSSEAGSDDSLISVPLIVKGDVAGSVEALVNILSSRQPQGIQLRVVQSGVGPISEGDMDMAISTKGMCLCWLGRDLN